MPALEVKKSKVSGRGVFATKRFLPEQVIEVCELIRAPKRDLTHLDQTKFYEYYFKQDGGGVIALGYGSLYNHSYEPNAYIILSDCETQYIFLAIRPIQKGEEIFINYNGEPDDQRRVWFDS